MMLEVECSPAADIPVAFMPCVAILGPPVHFNLTSGERGAGGGGRGDGSLGGGPQPAPHAVGHARRPGEIHGAPAYIPLCASAFFPFLV